jgi:hypothetical protein
VHAEILLTQRDFCACVVPNAQCRVLHLDAGSLLITPLDELFARNVSLVYTTDPSVASDMDGRNVPVQVRTKFCPPVSTAHGSGAMTRHRLLVCLSFAGSVRIICTLQSLRPDSCMAFARPALMATAVPPAGMYVHVMLRYRGDSCCAAPTHSCLTSWWPQSGVAFGGHGVGRTVALATSSVVPPYRYALRGQQGRP